MSAQYACAWSTSKQLESAYHDSEWGMIVTDDQQHFEMLTLEGAQAGLSWYTVLLKRDNYRQAFHQFDPVKVAQMTDEDIATLLQNEGIIRHKGKISATIHNAARVLEIQQTFGSFNQYMWQFVDFKPIDNAFATEQDIPSSTELSDKVCKDLKKRGFKFVGTTTVYAYMQAIGMVNDHVTKCFCYQKVVEAQGEFAKRHAS